MASKLILDSDTANNFSPVKKRRVTDQVVEKILNLINDKILLPGDKLPSQRELERMLDVSRSTLREALSGLIMTGYIESRIGQGFYVCSTNGRAVDAVEVTAENSRHIHKVIQQIYESRAVIETDISGLAAIRARQSDIKKLYRCVKDIERSLPDEEALLKGLEFHQIIAEAAQNSILYDIEQKMLEHLSKYILTMYNKPTTYERDVKLHLDIIKAIESHDCYLARDLAYRHIMLFAEAQGFKICTFFHNYYSSQKPSDNEHS